MKHARNYATTKGEHQNDKQTTTKNDELKTKKKMDVRYSDRCWVFRWILGIQMYVGYSDGCWVFRCVRNMLICNVLEPC